MSNKTTRSFGRYLALPLREKARLFGVELGQWLLFLSVFHLFLLKLQHELQSFPEIHSLAEQLVEPGMLVGVGELDSGLAYLHSLVGMGVLFVFVGIVVCALFVALASHLLYTWAGKHRWDWMRARRLFYDRCLVWSIVTLIVFGLFYTLEPLLFSFVFPLLLFIVHVFLTSLLVCDTVSVKQRYTHAFKQLSRLSFVFILGVFGAVSVFLFLFFSALIVGVISRPSIWGFFVFLVALLLFAVVRGWRWIWLAGVTRA